MTAPLRLLVLVHAYPPAIGGVERSISDMCRRLAAGGRFEVTVLTTDVLGVAAFANPRLRPPGLAHEEVIDGVRVLRFGVRAGLSRALKQPQRLAYHLRLPGNARLRTWFNGPISPGMRAAARRFDADVVCAASFPLNHLHYAFARPRTPVVLIPSAHTNDGWGFERTNLFRLVRRAEATVARSEHEREWLVARGADPDRVWTIPHGIDPDALRPRPGAFRAAHGIEPDSYLVAYVGQHGPHKGIDTLIAAFPSLLSSCPDARLVVAGARTPYSEELERRLATLPPGARSRCLLQRDLDEQQKADLLGDCDVLATPSAKEAFGITTLEAWSLAKPVVVGDSPAQKEIVEDGRSGLIVRHGDREGLAAALSLLERRGGFRAALGIAGRRRLLAHYTADHVEAQHARLLAQVASKGLRAPAPLQPLRARTDG